MRAKVVSKAKRVYAKTTSTPRKLKKGAKRWLKEGGVQQWAKDAVKEDLVIRSKMENIDKSAARAGVSKKIRDKGKAPVYVAGGYLYPSKTKATAMKLLRRKRNG